VLRLTPSRLDQLERAVRDGRRVSLVRRGTEYVVVAKRLQTSGRRDALIGFLPMTGDELTFYLDDLESLEIL
jgi:hypothetical protein